jgi:hypothetical protein
MMSPAKRKLKERRNKPYTYFLIKERHQTLGCPLNAAGVLYSVLPARIIFFPVKDVNKRSIIVVP